MKKINATIVLTEVFNSSLKTVHKRQLSGKMPKIAKIWNGTEFDFMFVWDFVYPAQTLVSCPVMYAFNPYTSLVGYSSESKMVYQEAQAGDESSRAKIITENGELVLLIK